MKKKETKNKTKLFSFLINTDLLKQAKAMADKEYRSIASVINQALGEFFEQRRNK